MMNHPRLRFSGFLKGWETTELQKLSRKNISYGIVQTGTQIENGVPCVRVVDLTKGSIDVNELIRTSEEISKSYRKTILEKDELMIALRGEIGLSGIVTDELVGCNLTRGIARVSPHKKNINSSYLWCYLNSDKVRRIFDKRKNGSALKEIPIGELKKIPVWYPELPEQTKIANFLTIVDERINLLTQQKAKLKLYKKGLMQQIFNQQLRFKDDDGNEFPEWEEKRLDSVIKKFIVPMRDKPKNLLGEIPWCRIEDFNGKYLIASKSNQGVDGNTIKEMNLKVFPVNTLLVSCSAYLGRCAIVKRELVTNQTFIGLVPNEKVVDVEFLFYAMRLSENRLNRLSSGTTISYLSREEFEKFKVNFPSLFEQQKIASFLSAIDKRIELVNQQIEQTKTWKKGLLQKMFV